MNDENRQVIKRQVEPVENEANYRILRTIADVEDKDVTELPPMYNYIDSVLDNLFDDPPDEKAEIEITFSFLGYRITVDQEGQITLRNRDALPDDPTESDQEPTD
jgi:hypothetical protein